jgi:hypothetical protein
MIGRVARPPSLQPGHFDGTYWIDEQIWGHRLYDEQTPWLTVLEFLTIFRSDPTLSDSLDLKYWPQRQLQLRNIVFNNPHMADLITDPPLPDAAAWERWLQLMETEGAQVGRSQLGSVKNRVPHFADFARLVGYLRRTAIEGNSNKRWSSKFVFPFGSDALYEDLRVSETGASNDRRFFARTGELLYLMLARSVHAKTLGPLLARRFFETPDATNAIVALLQGKQDLAPDRRTGGYLPYQVLPEFDLLAEDWLSLLRQPLPKFDVLPHLVTLTGLHLLVYFLRRAAAEVDGEDRPTFVCEIVGPRRSAIRDLALRSFERNQALPRMAMEHLIRSVTVSPEWAAALSDPEPLQAAAKILANQFDWPDGDELENLPAERPHELIDELVKKASMRHKQHLAKVHGSWARTIGLSSRRGSQRVRYAPTDGLLKSLVLCNVHSRMEFKSFLMLLYYRYGFIIGEQQAAAFLEHNDVDLEDFSENASRLEERLTSLGLMQRLSDGCAYVHLPFGGQSRHG